MASSTKNVGLASVRGAVNGTKRKLRHQMLGVAISTISCRSRNRWRSAHNDFLRARAKDIAPEVNAFWQNQSFHNYADYAMSGGFRSGLARLRDLGRLRRCAVMCAEAVWWRCHRRIIADYLVVGGDQVFHILAPGKVAIASLTTAARPGPEDTVTYPAQ